MIKKAIFTALALLLAFSQGYALKPIVFGVHGGANFTNLDFDGAKSGPYALTGDADPGFHFGASMRVRLPFVYIEPGLLYSHNSYKLTASDDYVSTSKVKINGFQFPVLVGTKISFVHLEAGPVFNIFNNVNTTVATINSSSVQYAPIHMVEMTRPSMGYMAGVGVELGPVQAYVRYNGDFGESVQNIRIATEQAAELKTTLHSWMLGVGFKF